jgi:hypothetical protein
MLFVGIVKAIRDGHIGEDLWEFWGEFNEIER